MRFRCRPFIELRILSLLVLAISLACSPPAPVPAPESAPEAEPSLDVLAGARLVDLSHAYDDDTLYWPTSPSRFHLEQLAFGETPGGYFYSSNAFCTPEHGGTHLDAPIFRRRSPQYR